MCEDEPSNCSYTGNLSLQLVSVSKAGCNKLRIRFKLLPLIVHQHINHIVAFEQSHLQTQSISLQDDEVVLEAAYTADLTGNISLIVDLAAYHVFRATNASTLQIRHSPLLPLLVRSDEECGVEDSVHSYLAAMQIVSYAILGVSVLLNCKIVGLELFGVLQLAFYDLAHHDFLNVYSEPLLDFKSVNGINVPFLAEEGQLLLLQ